jgi:hypothetical protein
MARRRFGSWIGGAAVLLSSVAAAAVEPSVISQVVVDAPPAQVWSALTTEAGLESWLAKDAPVNPGSGCGECGRRRIGR